MGAVATATQAAGAGVGAYGAYQSGLAQQNYYRYLSANSRTEADLALQEGQAESSAVQDEAAYKTTQLNRKVAETEGAQSAAEAANGTAGSVTAADIATDTSRKSFLDRMAVRYNADLSSWKAKNNAALKAWGLNKQAEGYDLAGNESKKAGKLGAFTSLLSGAGQVASSWYNLKRSSPTSIAAARD